MRTIQLNEKEMGLKATALSPHLYKKDFKRDIMADIAKFIEVEKTKEDGSKDINFEAFDTVVILQLAYIMNKTYKFGSGSEFPTFEKWLQEDADGFDLEVMGTIVEEAIDGLFPRAKSRNKHPATKQ
ncbi:hypothetical protein [Clostridium cellulovorans]|uniref:Phage related protein n=1 Tax=Clostridium cellulovorans (strain ATCC 35296 / DSM 3052 / OCM 3 / 743B) TaxID=573061 RepID=D9SQ07_CLOC7|nr:hypothetical protein [Clostridium cellulovorans]ADL52143.1 phage related protein [Clostridium cellulovorans 743B]